MTAVRSVLVVGGGITGNSLTVLLRAAGVRVDLVELTPDWNVLGSGITLQGNAIRVLYEMGVWERIRPHGYSFDRIAFVAPDGTPLRNAEDVRTGGPKLPAGFGIQRPDLQRVLIEAVRESGARVRLGCTVDHLEQDGDGVEVWFDDGSRGRYDLVVAADGHRSALRAMIGIPDRPEPVGLAVWRVTAPRPDQVRHTHICLTGPCYTAGYTPTGPESLYAFLVVARTERSQLPPPSARATEARRLASDYRGVWDEIGARITSSEQVNYTGFEQLLVAGRWHRGRVVLVGDSAHCCPPTIAQGAAMSLEDTLVLAELLTSADHLDDALLDQYRDRRFNRVRMVVDNSVLQCHWLLENSPEADIPGMLRHAMTVLSERP